MPARILIVDDDLDILSGLKRRLEWMGHDTVTAKDGVEALAAIQQEAPLLVLLDLELPTLSGIDIIRTSTRPRVFSRKMQPRSE